MNQDAFHYSAATRIRLAVVPSLPGISRHREFFHALERIWKVAKYYLSEDGWDAS